MVRLSRLGAWFPIFSMTDPIPTSFLSVSPPSQQQAHFMALGGRSIAVVSVTICSLLRQPRMTTPRALPRMSAFVQSGMVLGP